MGLDAIVADTKRPPQRPFIIERKPRAAAKPAAAGARAPASGEPRARKQSEGFAARDCAVSALFSVFVEKHGFDDAFNKSAETRQLDARDRALARMIAMTALRHRRSLNAAVSSFLATPLPEKQGRLEAILTAAAAQLLYLNTPPHAVISIAVDQCRADRGARNYAKLANAVLRKVSLGGDTLRAAHQSDEAEVPDWMFARWTKTYGRDEALRIATASLQEAALDLTVPRDAGDWASRLGGTFLPTGSVRLAGGGRIEAMDGFTDGAWWVQDAAAALPARLLGDVRGQRVLDVCAAPGGKTAQLAAAGAIVTALDKSPGRLKRVVENCARLNLTVETVQTDATTYMPREPFDAVLVDAPCSATGTIRRHPDILHLKREDDIGRLAAIQARVLNAAAGAVKPGGLLVYCSCSLEPEEGEQLVATFLAENANFARVPIAPAELAASPADAAPWITADGALRTLPYQFASTETAPDGAAATAPLAGCDGFYAVRLRRTG